MSARVILLFISLVLLWTGFPTQERSASDARAIMGLVDAAGEADLKPHVHSGSGDLHHLDEQPAQPHAEGGADLPELIPVRYGGLASSRTFAWEAAYVGRARIPPYLDGPQRPPDASRIVA